METSKTIETIIISWLCYGLVVSISSCLPTFYIFVYFFLLCNCHLRNCETNSFFTAERQRTFLFKFRQKADNKSEYLYRYIVQTLYIHVYTSRYFILLNLITLIKYRHTFQWSISQLFVICLVWRIFEQ